jgi:agmatinase
VSSYRNNRFLGAKCQPVKADFVILGVPFDGTSTFLTGSRFGPASIRFWSDVLETYSPALDLDLEDLRLGDQGDLDVPATGWEVVAATVETAVGSLAKAGKIPLVLGGEHLITLACVHACFNVYPDLVVLQLDAHFDLRDEYESEKNSHATVMRRVQELLGADRVFQWGIRSGTRDEWEHARRHGSLIENADDLKSVIKERPVYLTLDLDVLDPSIMPETGTPEPGGVTFLELQDFLVDLKGIPFVGADIMEYCPTMARQSGSSGATAAKAAREIILLCEAGRANLFQQEGALSYR